MEEISLIFCLKVMIIFAIMLSFNLFIKFLLQGFVSCVMIDLFLFIPQVAIGFILCKMFKL